MKTPVYLSTGAFVGRINGRNWHLPVEFADRLECDGFEFMIFPDFVEILPEIIREFRSAELNIPVVHAEKHLGDLVSDPTPAAMEAAEETVRRDCDAAARLYPAGRPKVVAHCWGIPDSDSHFEDCIVERIGRLREIADSFGTELLPENSFCKFGSPLEHFTALSRVYPQLHFIVDTRCAAFHGELDRFTASEVFRDRVVHIHINDYAGGYKDWDAMYPIPQPTRGNIDWEGFFQALRSLPYTHSITQEAPSMLPEGVDCATLNGSLRFIHRHMADPA